MFGRSASISWGLFERGAVGEMKRKLERVVSGIGSVQRDLCGMIAVW